MLRRTFLASAVLAAPAIARAQTSRVLRYVPEADVTSLDPVWTTATITGTHALLVYDQLFGQDSNLRATPQMAAGAVQEDAGRTWRITLRDGLLFHDGEPVLARDCAASIRRWGRRDPFGQALLAATDTITAPDDRTLVFRLKQPFPLLPDALGKPISSLPIIMPERLATTDAFTQVTDPVGSGPCRFVADERVPGARAVYKKFDRYQPRPDGTPDRTSGPKVMNFDRIEFQVIPDAATAVAALQRGEVDWVAIPSPDLLPLIRRDAKLEVAVKNTAGWIGMLRMNQLHPPFDNPDIRRALLAAVDQSAFMAAVGGDDRSLWRDGVGFFPPGVIPTGDSKPATPADPAATRRAIEAAGYHGQVVAVLSPADRPDLKAIAEVGADLMRRVGFTVDEQSLDWGTLVQRRAKKDPPDKGGWSVIPVDWTGMDAMNPASYPPLRANGAGAWFGWPDAPEIERLRTAWLTAPDAATQARIMADLQRQAYRDVPFIPVGQYFTPTAFSRTLTGIQSGTTVFWSARHV